MYPIPTDKYFCRRDIGLFFFGGTRFSDITVASHDIKESVSLVPAIGTAERPRCTRQQGLADFVNRLRAG